MTATTPDTSLVHPFVIGDLVLRNRIVADGDRSGADRVDAGLVLHEPPSAPPRPGPPAPTRDAAVRHYVRVRQQPLPGSPEATGIARAVSEITGAARTAVSGGFDGVEIDGARGSALEEFLDPDVNRRTDRYGGAAPDRCRLLLEIVDRVADTVGADRCGVRLSPYGRRAQDPTDRIADTYLYLALELGELGLAYVHLEDTGRAHGSAVLSDEFLREFREAFTGPVMLGGGLTAPAATDLLRLGLLDLAVLPTPSVAGPGRFG